MNDNRWAARAIERAALTDADDEEYQEGASRFRRQQDLVNARQWLNDDADTGELETQLADLSPLFWLLVRYWLVVLIVALAIVLFQHHHAHQG